MGTGQPLPHTKTTSNLKERPKTNYTLLLVCTLYDIKMKVQLVLHTRTVMLPTGSNTNYNLLTLDFYCSSCNAMMDGHSL